MKKIYEPNKETIEALNEVDDDDNLLSYDTLEEFWESLGLNEVENEITKI